MNFALHHKPLKTPSNLGLFPRLAFHESRAGACILFILRLDHVVILFTCESVRINYDKTKWK